jgi:UDP-N-acetyl-D-glucosamine dehydrogenase
MGKDMDAKAPQAQTGFDRLASRLDARTATVGICGMGYVGLPLAMAAWGTGFSVIAFDTDLEKVRLLTAGESYLKHIAPEKLAAMAGDARFAPTGDFDRFDECDVITICVPTPLGRHGEPDLSYVEKTAEAIAARLRPAQLIILESTTYPGTTAEVVAPILAASGLRQNTDYFVAYSPEREDPGNRNFTTRQVPKIVGGMGGEARDLACRFYEKFVERVVPVSSAEAAEAVKITENVFRAVNIALVNELKVIYDAMGIDIWEVIEAAKTKPFGYMPFYPGPGLGGHCIPIAPFYLTWKAREYGVRTRFIELAGEINARMPTYVVERSAEAMDKATGQGLSGAKVLLIGLAYKPNVDDIRESPALEILERFEARGATVKFHDPWVAAIPKTREHAALAGRRSTDLSAAAISAADLVVVVTDHKDVDYRLIADNAKLIVDTRNAFAKLGIHGAQIKKA